MKEVLVSIIIPNFNKEKYVIETLHSLKQQTHKNIEVITVDDNSTDGSIKIIENFISNDKRFVLLKNDTHKKGGSVCRNIGLNYAQGDYIIFLDSDDLFLPDTIANRVLMFQSYPQIDFLVFSTGTFKYKIGDNHSTWKPHKNEHLKHFLKHEISWNIMAPIWKKEILIKHNGFDEDYPRLQDVELHTRVLLNKDTKYKVFPNVEVDCYYRIDEERIVSNYEEFVKKWVNGIIMYINKTSDLIRNTPSLNQKRFLKYLNGTLLSIITQILYSYQQDKISLLLKNELLDKLLTHKQLSSNSHSFIKYYIKGYEMGFYKIKGFNFISKQLVTKL